MSKRYIQNNDIEITQQNLVNDKLSITIIHEQFEVVKNHLVFKLRCIYIVIAIGYKTIVTEVIKI